MSKYVLDANVVFSALISVKEIFIQLFENNKFFSPDFILVELDKYRTVILKKSKLPIDDLQEFIQKLFQEITIIPALYIIEKNKLKAKELCFDIDEKDTAYVALSIEMNYPLVTRDQKLYEGLKSKGFENVILLDELMKPNINISQ